MVSYKVFFKRSAEKELRKIPTPYLSRTIGKIQTLSKDPRPEGVQMLKGEEKYFRLRVNDYRIIYEVNDAKQEITIIKIGHRREVYER